MSLDAFDNLTSKPSAERSRRSYEQMASDYDSTCTKIEALRMRAVHQLALKQGETVLDVACGTGAVLPTLSQLVGEQGKVIGIEQSPEMAKQARRRLGDRISNVTLAVSGMSNPEHDYSADAVLMCYTQDVLQSAADVAQLIKACKPGARIVILGMKTLPWLWGWPVNLFNMYRARHYMTTYISLDRPYRLLEKRGALFQPETTALWGSAYIVSGRLK
jgi:ubiquinone/menaquinone biosynthesis C-methylase UbiE